MAFWGGCWSEVVVKEGLIRKEKGGFLDLEVKVFHNGVGGSYLKVLQCMQCWTSAQNPPTVQRLSGSSGQKTREGRMAAGPLEDPLILC